MPDSVPWTAHLLRGAVVLVVVLLFQQIIRGEPTPVVAIAVAIGYVLVAEAVRRYRSGPS